MPKRHCEYDGWGTFATPQEACAFFRAVFHDMCFKLAGPSMADKILACSHYSTPGFDDRKWDWHASVPPSTTVNWTPESWVKWVDKNGGWHRRDES